METKKEAIKYTVAAVAVSIGILLIILAFIYGPAFLVKGNMDFFDGLTNKSNTYTYAEVLLPSGKVKAGAVKSWRDYESDAVKIIFEDGTDIITSYNRAVLSKGAIKP